MHDSNWQWRCLLPWFSILSTVIMMTAVARLAVIATVSATATATVGVITESLP